MDVSFRRSEAQKTLVRLLKVKQGQIIQNDLNSSGVDAGWASYASRMSKGP